MKVFQLRTGHVIGVGEGRIETTQLHGIHGKMNCQSGDVFMNSAKNF